MLKAVLVALALADGTPAPDWAAFGEARKPHAVPPRLERPTPPPTIARQDLAPWLTIALLSLKRRSRPGSSRPQAPGARIPKPLF
jgi:hypothetical protein